MFVILGATGKVGRLTVLDLHREVQDEMDLSTERSSFSVFA